LKVPRIPCDGTFFILLPWPADLQQLRHPDPPGAAAGAGRKPSHSPRPATIPAPPILMWAVVASFAPAADKCELAHIRDPKANAKSYCNP